MAAGFHSNQARTHLIWISQPSKNTPDLDQDLQPHGPLLDQFNTTGLRYRSLCSVYFQMHTQNFQSDIHFAEEHPDKCDTCEAGTGF